MQLFLLNPPCFLLSSSEYIIYLLFYHAHLNMFQYILYLIDVFMHKINIESVLVLNLCAYSNANICI